MECSICEVDYPIELLNELVILDRGGLVRQNMCGICALNKSNERLPSGYRRTEFQGEQAELMRLQAIEHRKKTNQKGK